MKPNPGRNDPRASALLGFAPLDGRRRPSLRGSFLRFKESLALLRAVLREIFDESAYERFLLRNQLSPSVETYATFCTERDRTKACRPRCC